MLAHVGSLNLIGFTFWGLCWHHFFKILLNGTKKYGEKKDLLNQRMRRLQDALIGSVALELPFGSDVPQGYQHQQGRRQAAVCSEGMDSHPRFAT